MFVLISFTIIHFLLVIQYTYGGVFYAMITVSFTARAFSLIFTAFSLIFTAFSLIFTAFNLIFTAFRITYLLGNL